jgi:hypothetical protein
VSSNLAGSAINPLIRNKTRPERFPPSAQNYAGTRRFLGQMFDTRVCRPFFGCLCYFGGLDITSTSALCRLAQVTKAIARPAVRSSLT